MHPMISNLTPIANESEACRFVSDFIYARSRIRLQEGKDALIRARLGKRIRSLGFDGLPAYCNYLRASDCEREFTFVVDALTTNFTNFLREESHFKFLVDQALPNLLANGRKKFRVWSAACASGEEPYSIAFYLLERYPLAAGWDWRITASDLSTKALEKAQLGLYDAERVKSIPADWLRRYFQRGVGAWTGAYRVKRPVKDQVEFRNINLIEPYQHVERFEVIFCRNVMIYFDRPTQEELVNQLCHFLTPGGYLIVGHSEGLHGLRVPLRCLRPSVFQVTSN